MQVFGRGHDRRVGEGVSAGREQMLAPPQFQVHVEVGQVQGGLGPAGLVKIQQPRASTATGCSGGLLSPEQLLVVQIAVGPAQGIRGRAEQGVR